MSIVCEISFIWCFIIFLIYICFIYFNNYFFNMKPLICMFIFSGILTLLLMYSNLFIGSNLFGGILFISESDIIFRNIIIFVLFIILLPMFISVSKKGLVYIVEYYVLSYILILSCMVILYCGDLISLFLFMEVQSMIVYIMISMKSNLNELSMGIRYFIIGSATALVFLFSFASVYSFSGISSLFDFIFIDLFLHGIYIDIIGSLLYLLFMLKLYIFPFHYLGSDLYRWTSHSIVIILSSVLYNIYIYLFSKIVFFYFCTLYIYICFIVVTIILNIFNIFIQQDIRAFLGLGTSIHSSLLILLLILSININIFIILLYTFIYIISVIILFILFFNTKHIISNMLIYRGTNIFNIVSASSISIKYSNILLYNLEYISSWAGLFKYYKYVVFIMSFSLWSLAGLPPFSGFFVKLSILSICFIYNHIFIFTIFIIFSIISSLYYIRIIKEFFYILQILSHYNTLQEIDYYSILLGIFIISLGIMLPEFFIFCFY